LIVKVHGMGDSVLIRLIIEQLKKRNPDIDIGVLAGPATREMLTMSTELRVHSYDQKALSVRSAYSALREIRRGFELASDDSDDDPWWTYHVAQARHADDLFTALIWPFVR